MDKKVKQIKSGFVNAMHFFIAVLVIVIVIAAIMITLPLQVCLRSTFRARCAMQLYRTLPLRKHISTEMQKNSKAFPHASTVSI